MHHDNSLLGFALAALLAACGDDGHDHDHDHDSDPPTDDTDVVVATDLDADGVSEADGDCNDKNDLIYPGARERSFDGVDSDCDGEDLPALGDDRYADALALLDEDEDGAVSLHEFEAACARSAALFGDARPGVVHTQASCGGTNLCRGFVLHPWLELFGEHDCRGVNGCAGWSCVETAEDLGRDGATLFEEAQCSWCHSGDEGTFKVLVPPGEDVQAWVDAFFDHSDERFLAAIAFGFRGISPGDVGASNMPAHYDRLSRAEMETLIAWMRTQALQGAHWTWGDDAEGGH